MSSWQALQHAIRRQMIFARPSRVSVVLQPSRTMFSVLLLNWTLQMPALTSGHNTFQFMGPSCDWEVSHQRLRWWKVPYACSDSVSSVLRVSIETLRLLCLTEEHSLVDEGRRISLLRLVLPFVHLLFTLMQFNLCLMGWVCLLYSRAGLPFRLLYCNCFLEFLKLKIVEIP